jgi:hypothetical protein
LIPDVDAVEAVIQNRDPDEEQLEKEYAGQAVQKLDLLAVRRGTFEGFGIGDEMFEKKSSDGHDSAERVETSQPERNALAGAEGRNT